jgi:cobalt-zinc-cadmium efflux system membrane fusion protein
MKKSFFILSAALLFSACGHQSSKTAPNDTTASSETTKITSSDTILDTPKDSLRVDGTTAATARPNEVIFNGTIVSTPQRCASVAMTMGGVVKRTSLLPGQFVNKGQLIAVIDNPDFITLQQTYLEAHAQTEFLKTEYERQQSLSAQQASPQKKAQSSKADYLSMKSKLDASAAQLALLGISTSKLIAHGIQLYLPVKAPISGYVTNLKINVGKYVTPGEEMCQIIDKSNFLLCLTAYEKDLSKLRINALIQFRINGMESQTFNARIFSIGQNVDKVNRSLEVYARILNANKHFRPGMYVSARFVH